VSVNKAKYEVIDGVRYRNGEAMIPNEVLETEYLTGRGKILAKRIKGLRLKNKLSQTKLADKSKVDRSIISKIERAKKVMSIAESKKIAKALNLTAESLLSGE